MSWWKKALGIAAQVVIPYAAPLLASSIATSFSLGVASKFTQTLLSGVSGMALGAGSAALLGQDWQRGGVIGGIGGGIGGYTDFGDNWAANQKIAGEQGFQDIGDYFGGGAQPTQSSVIAPAPGDSFEVATREDYRNQSGDGLMTSESSFIPDAGGPADANASGIYTTPSGIVRQGYTGTPGGQNFPSAGGMKSFNTADVRASLGEPASFMDKMKSTGLKAWDKVTDPDVLADKGTDAILGLGTNYLAGLMVPKASMSAGEKGALAANEAAIARKQAQDEEAYNFKAARAADVKRTGDYYANTDYFGQQSANRVGTAGTRDMNEALRGTDAGNRASMERRFKLGNALNKNTAYTSGAEGAARRSQAAYTGAAGIYPSGSNSSVTNTDGLQSTYSDLEARKRKEQQNAFNLTYGTASKA